MDLDVSIYDPENRKKISELSMDFDVAIYDDGVLVEEPCEIAKRNLLTFFKPKPSNFFSSTDFETNHMGEKVKIAGYTEPADNRFIKPLEPLE